MFRQTLVVGPLQCNCVILGCEKTKEAVIIDPGDEAPKILSAVQKTGLKVKYLLHTHAHFDHVGATAKLNETLGAPPCLHRDDEMLYDNLPMQGRLFGMTFTAPPKLQKYLDDEEILSFGEYRLQVLHTPGHSPGSACFKLLDDTEAVYSGDTLFQGSIGRADLWGGSQDTLIQSIKRRLLVLDDDISVHPGHGPDTSIGIERRSNPFL